MNKGNTPLQFERIVRILVIAIIVTAIIGGITGIIVGMKYIFPEQDENTQQNPESYSAPSENIPLTPISNIDSPHYEEKDFVDIIPPFTPDDPDYFNAQLGAKDRPVQEIAEEKLQTLFTQKFRLDYTPISIKAEVSKGPLVIQYNVSPDTSYSKKYDPGRLNPYFTYMEIKVSDEKTGELVAEDGYGKMYGFYTEKTMKILSAGTFRIDIYGKMVDVDLKISSGV